MEITESSLGSNSQQYRPQSELLLESLRVAGPLQEDYIVVNSQLQALTDQRDTEIDQVKERWQAPIEELALDIRQKKDVIVELHKVIQQNAYDGFKSGQISEEDLLYSLGLVTHEHHSSYCLDFDQASDYVERFHEMQSGTKVILWSGRGDVGSINQNLSVFGIDRSGVLTEKPTLILLDSEYDTGFKIQLNFQDGQQFNESWSRQIAIGDEQVDNVVSAWLDTNRAVLYSSYVTNVKDLSETMKVLVKLVPLDLEIPAIDVLRQRIFEVFWSTALSEPLTAVNYLPDVKILSEEFYQEVINVLISRYPFHNNPGKLIKAVAKSKYFNWKDISKYDQHLALAEASQEIAQMQQNN